MPKKCKAEDCDYNVFSTGYCKIHQYLRTDPKKPKPLNRTAIQSKPKAINQISDKRKEKLKGYSQKDMFAEIWDERPHVSELSGDELLPKGHSQWHWQFLHVLPKGSFPKFELKKENILLGTVAEHDHQDQYEVFRKKKVELLKEYYGPDKFI